MALGCTAAAAHAESFFEIEAGIGGAAYQRGPNGLWMQDGFQHELHLTAPAIEVGFTGNIIQRQYWGIDWHADWAWLGTVHTDAMVPSANTNTTSGKWIGPDLVGVNAANPCSGPCNNLSRFIGSGHDMGFMLTIEPHVDYGGWRFGVEGGPYIHRSSWSEDVVNWVGAAGDAPKNIHVAYRPEWRVGYVIGASVGYKNFSLAYQFFKNGVAGTSSNPYPPIWANTHMLLVKYRF
ncbi:hypothetical protein [Paraburkholderia nemoris]|uniref:hypothetical protein n=1 Tax=Paraburkholderia nemoris TaxID=2793076 RepID=UPI001B211C5E|nr:hypothetical protein [Paraburkholderia nemoris]CAE6837970.1 hypothetical protein R75777_06925 [Paraburkholderia nemoris]